MVEQTIKFDHVLALALRLSPLDKIRLIKEVAATLVDELARTGAIQPPNPMTSPPTWGAQVLAVLDQMGTSEWEAMDIPDVVEWVKEQRRKRDEQRRLRWDDPD